LFNIDIEQYNPNIDMYNLNIELYNVLYEMKNNVLSCSRQRLSGVIRTFEFFNLSGEFPN